MNILAAIKREERKLEQQLSKLQKQLDAIRTAAKALGHSTGRELNGVGRAKKRHVSASARAKMSKAQKARWANALGHSAGNGLKSAKKRVLSAAGRAAISKAAKRRWAKAKAQAKKAAA